VVVSYAFYKVLHLLGVMVVFLSLGGAAVAGLAGVGREPRVRKLLAATHGVAILVVLIAGFGLLAKLGLSWPIPGWAWAKLVIWALLGGALGLATRRPAMARLAWWLVPLLGLVAAWLAVFKP
jgi:hypothetical protein